MSGFGKDIWHKEVRTLADLYKVNPRRWGMQVTVYADPTPANNTTWVLVYNLASTNKADNNNWQVIASYAGGNSWVDTAIDSSGPAIALNQGNNAQVNYVLSVDIDEAKTFTITNVTGAQQFRMRFTIVNALTDILTWPANFFMSDARWDAATKEWTPDDAGDFEAIGTYDGTNWFLKINGPYD